MSAQCIDARMAVAFRDSSSIFVSARVSDVSAASPWFLASCDDTPCGVGRSRNAVSAYSSRSFRVNVLCHSRHRGPRSIWIAMNSATITFSSMLSGQRSLSPRK